MKDGHRLLYRGSILAPYYSPYAGFMSFGFMDQPRSEAGYVLRVLKRGLLGEPCRMLGVLGSLKVPTWRSRVVITRILRGNILYGRYYMV